MSAGEERTLGIGLVGCGRIARTHLEALVYVDDCRLTGVCDTDEEAARSLAEEFGAPPFTDYRRLLDTADAVIVCTPPNTHLEIAGGCLDGGAHVLCEKPLALTTSEAEELVTRAETTGRLLMMASKFRYTKDVIAGKSIVDAGVVGEVILYENVFCSRVDMRDRWNSRAEVSGGGVLIDNGTHSVDIARYLLGPITKVQAQAGQRLQGLEVEDTCRLALQMASGAMGTVDLSWSINKERDAFVEVFGSKGVLSIGWNGSKYRCGDDRDWIRCGEGYDKAGAFVRQLRNFVGAIRGVEAPVITAEDALESVRVVEAAYRSMQQDNWVPVAETGAAAGRGGAS